MEKQGISDVVIRSLEITAKLVHDHIMEPMEGISNISEWAKRDICWNRLRVKTAELKTMLPAEFWEELVWENEIKDEIKSAVKVQKIETGIEAQTKVLNTEPDKWAQVLEMGQKNACFLQKRQVFCVLLPELFLIKFRQRSSLLCFCGYSRKQSKKESKYNSGSAINNEV